MVTVRPAEHRDSGGSARLAHDAYQHYTARIGRPPAPLEAAEDGDELLGFIVLVDDEDHLFVENVTVDPRVQGGEWARSSSLSPRRKPTGVGTTGSSSTPTRP